MENTALCPLDGRYSGKLGALSQIVGEAAFSAYRLQTEVAWLQLLSEQKLPYFKSFSTSEKKLLSSLSSLSPTDLSALRAIEFDGYKGIPATRHDVKALEYFLRLKLKNTSLKDRLNWIHFALTSEDVNSVSYALLLANGVEKSLCPLLEKLRQVLAQLARKEAGSVLLARTHGQPAVPTTFGKEIRVFEARLARQIAQLKRQQISCKFGGAVGNFSAHIAAFPKINWPRLTDKLIGTLNKGRKIKIYRTPVSTQIDPRDTYAELFDNVRRINVILIDFCRDMWQYISAGLVAQRTVRGEVGSSTMPQKVNPIDFENAEGNLQLASALCDFFSNKLPVSRLQRDLSDSTVLRNMGMVFGYITVACESILRGVNKIAFDRAVARGEVQRHPEVLAEAVQTILRAHGCENAYELLRNFTRGQRISAGMLADFIDGLTVPASVKMQLHQLEPEKYIGLASKLAEEKYD